MDCSMPVFPVHHQRPQFIQTHVHWVSDATQTSHPLSFPSPSAFYISQQQDLSKESVICIMRLKYWSLNFSICPSNEYSGLISFRIDWFDLLAVQGTLKSLLQCHSLKAWTNSVVILIVSGEQQKDSAIHTHIHSPPDSPSIQATTQHWAEFHMLYSRSLLVIHFKYISVYMLIPNSLIIPSTHPPTCTTVSSFSKSMSLFLFGKLLCIVSF